MRPMKVIFLVATILVFGFGYSDRRCYCIPPSVQASYDNSKAVFVGEVLEVIPPQTTDPRAGFVDVAHTIKFRVEKSWKGVFFTDTSVMTRLDSCPALNPKKGDRYLVFARAVYPNDPSHSELATGPCDRTALLSEISTANIVYRNQAADDIRTLNSMIIFGPHLRPAREMPF